MHRGQVVVVYQPLRIAEQLQHAVVMLPRGVIDYLRPVEDDVTRRAMA